MSSQWSLLDFSITNVGINLTQNLWSSQWNGFFLSNFYTLPISVSFVGVFDEILLSRLFEKPNTSRTDTPPVAPSGHWLFNISNIGIYPRVWTWTLLTKRKQFPLLSTDTIMINFKKVSNINYDSNRKYLHYIEKRTQFNRKTNMFNSKV